VPGAPGGADRSGGDRPGGDGFGADRLGDERAEAGGRWTGDPAGPGWPAAPAGAEPPAPGGRGGAGGRVVAVVDRPWSVYTLIAVNTAIYLATAVQAGSAQYNSDSLLFEGWSLIPPQVLDGQWWRMITSGFLHFGVTHLAVNMWSLWVIGKDFERVLGRGRFLAVYLVSLLGGSLSALLFSAPISQVAGASGAVFGLMGGLTVVLHRLRVSMKPALIMIAINLVFSVVVPNISLADHLGGLLVGAAATLAILHRR
jgi:membrane associated rhomboid family serine protease